MPKYVVSLDPQGPEWNNSTVLDGDRRAAVSKLKGRHDGEIVVHGSAQLAQGLIEHDLVDELRLMVFPVVLGSGKRLFGAMSDKKPLGSPTRKSSATASRSSLTSDGRVIRLPKCGLCWMGLLKVRSGLKPG